MPRIAAAPVIGRRGIYLALLIIVGFALLIAACGGAASPVPTDEPEPTPKIDLEVTQDAQFDELEREIIDGLIDLFPRSCLNEDGALTAAQSLLPQGPSQQVLDRAKAIKEVCQERGLWLGN